MSTYGTVLQQPAESFATAPAEERARPAPGARTYRGRSLEELIPRIQGELGADAVIIRRREGLTGGVLGFFQHAFVELEVVPGGPQLDVYDAHEPVAPPMPEAVFAPEDEYVGGRAPELRITRGAFAPQEMDELTAEAEHAFGSLAADAPAIEPGHGDARAGSEHLSFEELLAGIALEAPAAPPRVEDPTPDAGPERREGNPGSSARVREGIEGRLLARGISRELAEELIEQTLAHTLALSPTAGLAPAVRMTLAQRIPIALPLPRTGATIAVVGPSGAGKTTICTSLLAAYRRGSTLASGFATLLARDGEQELALMLSPALREPVPAGSVAALDALAELRGRGLAVIDTPAVSAEDTGAMTALARALAALRLDRVIVALPAAYDRAQAIGLLQALAPLHPTTVALTVSDATDRLGTGIEAACAAGLAPELLLEHDETSRLRRVEPLDLAARLLA